MTSYAAERLMGVCVTVWQQACLTRSHTHRLVGHDANAIGQVASHHPADTLRHRYVFEALIHTAVHLQFFCDLHLSPGMTLGAAACTQPPRSGSQAAQRAVLMHTGSCTQDHAVRAFWLP